jgi:hypothetical protein
MAALRGRLVGVEVGSGIAVEHADVALAEQERNGFIFFALIGKRHMNSSRKVYLNRR